MQPIPVEIKTTGIDRIVPYTTLFLALFTIFLAMATVALVLISRKTMQRELRPYISFKDFNFRQIVGVDKVPLGWQFAVIWQNTGQTFTKNMHSHLTSVIIKPGEDHGLEFPSLDGLEHENLPRISVGPGASTGGGAVEISIDDLLVVQKGEERIFIRGWAQYGDMFNPKVDCHRTEFCFEIFCVEDPLITPCFFPYGFHSSHNRSDGEIARRFDRIPLETSRYSKIRARFNAKRT